MVFVATGYPKQEEFIERNRAVTNGLWMGIGGSFDVLTGTVKRAPATWQKNALGVVVPRHEGTRTNRQTNGAAKVLAASLKTALFKLNLSQRSLRQKISPPAGIHYIKAPKLNPLSLGILTLEPLWIVKILLFKCPILFPNKTQIDRQHTASEHTQMVDRLVNM